MMDGSSLEAAPLRSFSAAGVAAYRTQVRAWISANLPKEWREGATPPDFAESIRRRREWDRLRAVGGYGGITWPREYGGRGEGPIEEFIFYEEAARAHAPDTANSIGYDLSGPALMEYGTAAQQARFLPGIIEARDLWCEGFSEPNAGSDLANVATRATRVEGGWRIDGHKIWTSRAQFADWCYLLCKTADGPRHRNLSVLLVDMHQPSIRVAPIRQISEGPEFNEVFFDGAFAPEENLLGTENDGWRLAGLSGFRQRRKVFDAIRWFVLVAESLDRLKATVAKPGGARFAQRYRELLGRTQALRWHAMRVTEMMAQDGEWLKPSSILRVAWSELWQDIAECGVAAGLPEEEAYWRMTYLETRAVTIHSGTAQIQRNVIADRTLELPR
jgi:alkylation response protein AidB-like acyl-CoA dehydrogenase